MICDRCGHDLDDHAPSLRCRVCGTECGINCTRRGGCCYRPERESAGGERPPADLRGSDEQPADSPVTSRPTPYPTATTIQPQEPDTLF